MRGHVFDWKEEMTRAELKERSKAIRARYHELEESYHGSKWTAEEDALAYLTDAALVGRYVMDHEGRWPSDAADELSYKLGECIWWLTILADREGLDIEECVATFLQQREDALLK